MARLGNMNGYGQFCPLALASEIIAERWTPLVLRELIGGARRFNEIHRGVPRMSPSLLSRRLRTLVRAGIIERRRSHGHGEYVLTDAGAALAPTIQSLAVWSKRWLPATLSSDRADPNLIMWDMHRRMNVERMPDVPTVIEFEFTDQPESRRLRWIVRDEEGVQICIVNPGYEVDLSVVTDSRVIALVWYGDMNLEEAIRQGGIRLNGPRRLCRAFPSWLQLNMLADVSPEWPVREDGDADHRSEDALENS
ncbi:MAG: winged helix-turn-helix transcriptional regulator [Halofilum sp. (in: g-proteobacteria)]